jgi:hypothetical protein
VFFSFAQRAIQSGLLTIGIQRLTGLIEPSKRGATDDHLEFSIPIIRSGLSHNSSEVVGSDAQLAITVFDKCVLPLDFALTVFYSVFEVFAKSVFYSNPNYPRKLQHCIDEGTATTLDYNAVYAWDVFFSFWNVFFRCLNFLFLWFRSLFYCF